MEDGGGRLLASGRNGLASNDDDKRLEVGLVPAVLEEVAKEENHNIDVVLRWVLWAK